MTIAFFVHGKPEPQPRQRHKRIHGYIHNYTPKSHPVNIWKATIGYFAKLNSRQIRTCAVSVTLCIYLSRPKSVTREYPTAKPDSDNLAKAIFDAMNGIIYKDDAQIIDIHIYKRYAQKTCGVKIIVSDEIEEIECR